MSKRKTAKKTPATKKVDEPLYRVVDLQGRPVYPGKGVTLEEAQRLSRDLRMDTHVVSIEALDDIAVFVHCNWSLDLDLSPSFVKGFRVEGRCFTQEYEVRWVERDV